MDANKVISRGFGDHFTPRPGILENDHEQIDFERTMFAFDQNDLVGATLSIGYKISLPGGSMTDLSGVTAVVVSATHRRRGILTEMMRRLLKNEHQRGLAIAGLWASESIIYGRFGYGNGIQQQNAKIDTRHAAFRKEAPNPSGRIRFVDPAHIREIGPEIWAAAALGRPGMVIRDKPGWNSEFRDTWDDPKPFFVTYEENGKPRGFAKYRIKFNSDSAGHDLQLNDIVGADTHAEIALWRFILSIDLVKTVTHGKHPKRSILWWLLEDPRRLSLQPYDALWVRILEPETALAARRYSAPGSLTIKIEDTFCPWADGTYRLDVDADGKAQCTRIHNRETPDLSMPTASIATIYMGAHSAQTLHMAGRIEEHSPGAVATADTIFNTSDTHYAGYEF